MAALQVKPTRMELSNLKKKRKVAVRGHKLMKDKRDEMVRRFILYIRKKQGTAARSGGKAGQRPMQGFVLARASMSTEAIEEACAIPPSPPPSRWTPSMYCPSRCPNSSWIPRAASITPTAS